jgi:hypothetical protein
MFSAYKILRIGASLLSDEREFNRMIEQELRQKLADMKRFDEACDELNAGMLRLTGPAWGKMRAERDTIEAASLALIATLSGLHQF